MNQFIYLFYTIAGDGIRLKQLFVVVLKANNEMYFIGAMINIRPTHNYAHSSASQIKAILRDLLMNAPSIYILLNKFPTVYKKSIEHQE